MRQQRTRLVVNVGNLLEIIGAAAAVYGVDRIWGLGFALILAGVLAVAAAELVYDAHTWRVPLPHRPQPRQRLAEHRQRVNVWVWRRRAAWHRFRNDLKDRLHA